MRITHITLRAALLGLLVIVMLLVTSRALATDFQIIESNSNVPDTGRFPVVLDPEGKPYIAARYNYYNGYAYSTILRLNHCDDVLCASRSYSTITGQFNPDNSYDPSIVLDAAGNPVIAFITWGYSQGLKLTHCNDPLCAGGDDLPTDYLDTNVGPPSLQLDASGNPVIAYSINNPINALKVIHCSDPSCTGPRTTNIVLQINAYRWLPDLELDASGNPVIAFEGYEYPRSVLMLARCNDPDCAGGDEPINRPGAPIYPYTYPLDSGGYPSLELDTDGFPIISYHQIGKYHTNDPFDNDLMLAHCNDPLCAGGDEILSQVDGATTMTGSFSRLVLGPGGFPVISYYDETNKDLRLARCNDINCSGGDDLIMTVDSVGDVGKSNELALNAHGDAYLAYLDATNLDVKLAVDLAPEPPTPDPTCYILAPESVAEGEQFTASVNCDSMTGVFGFEIGTSSTGPASTSATGYTPGTFVTDAGSDILESSNTLSNYAVTRSAPASAANGNFNLGSVNYTADSGLMSNGSVTLSIEELLLGDISGAPIDFTIISPTTITVIDLLSLNLTVISDGTVQQVRDVTAMVDGDTLGPQTGSGTSLALNFVDTIATSTPILTADMKSHLLCSGSITLPASVNGLTTTLDAGDVTLNGADASPRINLFDAVAIGLTFNTSTTGEEDVNGDGTVNIFDLIHVGRNYGAVSGPCS